MLVILHKVVLLVVVLCNLIPGGTSSGGACTGSIFDDSNFADGGTTGSWAVYGRGILVNGGSISGADGSMVGHVGGGQV